MRVRELCISYGTRDIHSTVEGTRIATPDAAAAVFAEVVGREAVEVCGLLCLSSAHDVLGYHELSRGTLDSAPVHPRELFKVALLANAAAVILGHNHPSGDPTPSLEDIALTRRLVRAGELMGVTVLDHLIVGVDKTHASLREMGLV